MSIFAPAIKALGQVAAFVAFAVVLLSAFIGVTFVDPHTKYGAARAQVQQLTIAVNTFKADCGRYPTESEGLDALTRNPGTEGWDGPYLTMAVPYDPWGRPYIYLLPASAAAPRILSSHPDEKPPAGLHSRHIVMAVWIAAWI